MVLESVRKALVENKEPPRILICALVVGEDHRFYQHAGVDFFAVCRALIRLVLYNRRQGGSTIEQQLARTITQDRAFTIKRKLCDWLLAARLSREFTKDELASAYLHLAYFGYSGFGYLGAASSLEINTERLSLMNATKIIALLKWPLKKRPSNDWLVRVDRRAEKIERRIVCAGVSNQI